MRHCVHCKGLIALPVLIKGRWKAIFCSPECRQLDRNAVRSLKREFFRAKGKCHTCKRVLPGARVQQQAAMAAEAC